MACYEVRLITIEFKAKHKDLLIKALESLGWEYKEINKNKSLSILNGSFVIYLEKQTVMGRDYIAPKINELKQQYSHEVLKKAASIKKWTMRKVKENKYLL